MKQLKIFKTVMIIFITFMVSNAMASKHNIDLSGEARVRAEAKNNGDYQKGAADDKSFTASRFRLNFSAKPDNSRASVFIQPQFTKTWGLEENNAGAGNTTSTDRSSGALNDTVMDVHQAWIDWSMSERVDARIGRQEINLGDQLLIGGVGWHNQARSFDALNLGYTVADGHKILGLASKVEDKNVSSSDIGDMNFYGLYYMGGFGDYLKEFDLYVLDVADHRGAQNNDVYSYGLRVKSKVGALDYRFEYTKQRNRLINGIRKKDEGQYDIEAGYTLDGIKTRFGAEYFSSTEHYDQLFPTAHKWLGFADQFSRRNIKGYVAHVKTNFSDSVFTKLAYHMFSRTNPTHPAYNFGGGALGNTGKSKKIADEFDLILGYNVDKNLKLLAGYSFVAPKKYLKDQNALNKDNTQWSFFQILANF